MSGRMRAGATALALLAAAAALTGCGGGGAPEGAAGAERSVDTVRVWFQRGEEPVAVERVVEGVAAAGGAA